MQVKVGDIAAVCAQCGSADFVVIGDSMRPEHMRCSRCEAETTRAQLLQQIGAEASRRAAESLARLRRERRMNRKTRKDDRH